MNEMKTKKEVVKELISKHKPDFVNGLYYVYGFGLAWTVGRRFKDYQFDNAILDLADKGFFKFGKPGDNGEFIETTLEESFKAYNAFRAK